MVADRRWQMAVLRYLSSVIRYLLSTFLLSHFCFLIYE